MSGKGETSSLIHGASEAHEEREWGTKRNLTNATYLLIGFQCFLLFLFGTTQGSELVTYGTGTQAYNMFIGIEIMMFIGFGYLMTFLKWYGLGAVGFTMLITAVGLQWYLFTGHFSSQIAEVGFDFALWTKVPINLYSLIDSLFGISTVLITFGALIGKVSPLQLLVLTIIELALHAFNAKVLMEGAMRVADLGGTYAEHMFGAYFGLAVAYVLGVPKGAPEMGVIPDMFSFIGTLFLWIYWPSFVSGAAEPDSIQQQQAIVNTILSLSASTIIAFCFSTLFAHDGRFRPVDIQNATLAGGVAIGCSANLNLDAFSAVVIGIVAGAVSCFGFNHIQPWLEKNFDLHDTCGIHNLHAMPSVIGGLASIFVAGYQQSGGRDHAGEIYGEYRHQQWWRQGVAILVCMGFAISTGLFTGHILKRIGGTEEEKASLPEYHDEPYWEVAPDYNKSVESEVAKLRGSSSKKSSPKSSLREAAFQQHA